MKHINDVVTYLENVAPTKFDTELPLSELKAESLGDQVGLVVDSRSPVERLYGQVVPALPVMQGARRNLFGRMGQQKGWSFFWNEVSEHLPDEGANLLNAMFANEHFTSSKRGPKQIMVRSRGKIKDIDAPSDANAMVRALFSNQYIKFDMLDVARIVQESAHAFENMGNTNELMETMRRQYGTDVTIDNGDGSDGIGHKLERVHITPDAMSFRLRLNMKFHTEELGNFNTGVFIKADEIGLTSVHILPYVWREWCKNGAISSFDRGELKFMRDSNGWSPIIRHRWGSTEDLIYKGTQAMAYAAAHGSELIIKARQAAYRKIPNAQDILARMLEAVVPESLRQVTTLNAGTGMEGENSVMGIVNGITASAHTEGLTQDTMDELEAIGGTSLRKFDANSTDKEIEALFLGLAKAELIEREV